MRIRLSTLLFFMVVCICGLTFLLFNPDGLDSLDRKLDEWTSSSESTADYSWVGSITERIYPPDSKSDIDAIFRSVVKTDYFKLSYENGGSITPIGTLYEGFGWSAWSK
jgi:hypothetical protein